MRTLRAVFAAALLAAAVIPSSSAARTLDLQHERTTVTNVGAGADGVVGPGDTVAIDESILSADSQAITGLTGTLSSATASGTVTQPSSAYPDFVFGSTAANSTPFQATIASTVVCGQNVPFTLDLVSGADSATMPVTVPTGEAAPAEQYPSPQTSTPLADNGTISTDFTVPTSGRIKDARIRIGRITHPYVADLQIAITAPDGTRIQLVENRGGSGDNFVGTVFAAGAGASIVSATAPFTGTFRPEGDLSDLVGRQQLGKWTLTVRDTSSADTGVLESWGGEIAKADCTPRAVAEFDAAPAQVAPGGMVNFDATASRVPGSPIAAYDWDLDGNGSYETPTGATPTVSRTYATRGAVVVGLRITSESGLQATTTRSIAVTQAPVASFTTSPAGPVSGQSVTFDASASYDVEIDGAIVRHEWDLDGDGTFEVDSGTVKTTQRSYGSSGTVLVRLRVTDNDGATSTVAQALTVDNRPPVAAITVPSPAIVGTPATFSAAASSDPDGQLAGYEWDLDGDPTSFEVNTGSVASAQRTFTTAGSYTVRVRVTDNEGATDIAAAVLTITQRPVARIVVNPKPSRPNQVVTLDASSSTDDGTVAAFAWDLDGNGTYETDTGSTPTASRAYALGDHAVAVRVTDNDGAAATQTATVSAVNNLPVAAITASRNPATAGEAVRFDASGSTDSDGTVVRHDWDLDGNGSFETTSGAIAAISYSYPNPGTVMVRVRAVDNDLGADIETLALTIQPAPEPAPPTDGGGTGETGTVGSGAAPTEGSGTALPAEGDAGAGTAGGGTSAGTGALPGGASGGPTAFIAALVGPSIQTVKRVTRSGLRLACQADRRATCRVTAELPAREARRLGLLPKASRSSRKPLRLAASTVVVPGGRDVTVILRLSAKVRRALGRAGRAQVLVRGTATDAAGGRIALSRTVLVRR